ncbi:MAG: pyrroloquinoline quinone precursor peptide PqqA [Silvibacterium sp.]|nr:pyrroloquinoline quinone precursor peptide PqqA [Silvibacterium sp.]
MHLKEAAGYLEDWRKRLMQWSKPDFVEVSVSCEINSYCNPEI